MTTNYWDSQMPENRNEPKPVASDEMRAYVKSIDFQNELQNQYKTVLQPNVFGCAISYDMTDPSISGDQQDWAWGKTEYDNGGYLKSQSAGTLVIPDGLGGLYLVFADVRINGASGQLAAIYIEIDRSIGGYSTVETFSSAPGTPVGVWTASTFESIHFSSIRLVNLSPGDTVSISGGADGSWTSGIGDNQLGIVRFPFGS